MADEPIHLDRDIVTRKEAIALGLIRYFTGKACPKGHLSERMVCDWKCVECRIEFRREKYKDPEYRAKIREWFNRRYAEHEPTRELRKALARAHHHANPEKHKKYHREYYLKNKAEYSEKIKISRAKRLECPIALERERERCRKKKASNPEATRADTRNRKARIQGLEGRHSKDDILEILERQKYLCTYCDADLSTVKYHVDHMTPVSRKGSNWPSNLQCLCAPCNLKKHAKTHEEYMVVLKKRPPE